MLKRFTIRLLVDHHRGERRNDVKYISVLFSFCLFVSTAPLDSHAAVSILASRDLVGLIEHMNRC